MQPPLSYQLSTVGNSMVAAPSHGGVVALSWDSTRGGLLHARVNRPRFHE